MNEMMGAINLRKYAGVAVGLVLSVLVGTSTMANTIGPNHTSFHGWTWNSEIFVDHTQNTDYFWIQQCNPSGQSMWADLMHHWFALPSTGTNRQRITCSSSATWRQLSWPNAVTADYSIETTQGSIDSSFWYQIQY